MLMKVKHLGEICIGPSVSKKEIRQVRNVLRNDTDLKDKIKLHQVLSGETRFKIVKLLNELDELCVCDLAEMLNTTVSAVSHQLKILRQNKTVKIRRKGQTIYYSLKNKEMAKLL